MTTTKTMLPKEIEITFIELETKFRKLYGKNLAEEIIEEFLNDFINEKYGHCNCGFDYEFNFKNDTIHCTNIEWDI